jgi:hypothetical protein
MLHRLGFVLLVLLFGGLMFLAGLLAPASVHGPVAQWARDAVGATLGEVRAAVDATLADAERAATASAVRAADDTTPDGGPDAPGVLAYGELVVPAPLPSEGVYGLQVGMLTDAGAAAARTAEVRAAGFDSRVIPVTDADGARWYVVTAGRHGHPRQAREARMLLATSLGVAADTFPVLLLQRGEDEPAGTRESGPGP